MNETFSPSFQSMKRPLGWFLFFIFLLSIGCLACVYVSPRGIDLNAFYLFVGGPLLLIFLPVCFIFLSYRIKMEEREIKFFQFFIPVKRISYKKITEVK